MNKKLFAVATALFFLSAVYGQKIEVERGLPLGIKVDRQSSVEIVLVSDYDSVGRIIRDNFQYNPLEGSLTEVVNVRVREFAAKFTPPVGSERAGYELFVSTDFAFFDSGGLFGLFKLEQQGSRWIIPPEVLNVKLDYGVSYTFKAPGAQSVRMRLFKNEQQIGSFDTDDPYNGYGFDLSACSIGATQDALLRGEVRIASRYAVASLWDGTWDYGEMDVLDADGGFVTLSLVDGHVVSYSTPPPVFLKTPEPKLAVQKTADGGLQLEVTGVPTDRQVVIESSTNLVDWATSPSVKLSGATGIGKQTFSLTATDPFRVFRLRVGEPTVVTRK